MSNVVGVDIGAGSLKAISLSKDGSGIIVLDAIGELKTPRVEWTKGSS